MAITILLMSRDYSLLSTRELLVRHAGYRSISATTVQEAHQLLSKEKPDLAVLDSTFPAVDRDWFKTRPQAGLSMPVLALDQSLTPPADFLQMCAWHLAARSGAGSAANVEQMPQSVAADGQNGPTRTHLSHRINGPLHELPCLYQG